MTASAALVTGASAGIGAAFARALAARGHGLVLTARRGDRLEALAAELRQRHGTRTLVVPLDLAAPGAVGTLCGRIGEEGWAIDWLVNNAGYGLPGGFRQNDWTTHAAFLRVMVEVPVELTHRLLPAMRARKHGRIVNVASLAGFLPGSAGHTLYGASKALLIRFSQSLAAEERGAGIHVCALCPGLTRSEFHDVSGARTQMDQLPRWLWQTAEAVVAEGIAAVEAGRATCVTGRVNRLIRGVATLIPDRLAASLAQRAAGRIGRAQG